MFSGGSIKINALCRIFFFLSLKYINLMSEMTDDFFVLALMAKDQFSVKTEKLIVNGNKQPQNHNWLQRSCLRTFSIIFMPENSDK